MFDKHNQNGKVTIFDIAEVVWGRI
jgi:hypothetical protein